MPGNSPKRIRPIRVFVFFLGWGCLFLSSCVTAGGPFSLAKRNAPVVFESEDYVVYSLGQGETPVTLAERFLGDGNKAWVLEDANKGVPFTKGQVVVIPLKGEKRWGLQANGFQVVPILCYHRFSGDCDSPLCLPSRVFDQLRRT